MVFYLNPRCAVTVVSVVCCFYRLIMQFFRNGILPQQILGDSATWKSLHIQPWKCGACHWKMQRSLICRWYQHNPLKLGIRAYGIHSHLSWANLNTIFRETADRRLESPVNVLQHWVRIVTCESCAHTSQGVRPPQGFEKSERFQVVWRFKWLANFWKHIYHVLNLVNVLQL